MFDESRWFSETVVLPPGSLLMLYTDGVEDTRNEAGEFYGPRRVVEAVRRAGEGAGVKDVLLNDLAAFRGSTPQYDDVSVVVVAREAIDTGAVDG
jgi:serine phosphatase RsbU (regulator of sigma subunit)